MRPAATEYFLAQARNNAWANRRLLDTCARLSEAEFLAPRSSFFPTLKATLNHILVVDWLYVDALEGGSLGPAAYADEEPCATVATLRREQAAVDLRLIAFCAALDEAALGSKVRLIREDGDRIERCDRVLLHLFQHQVHHRGQAHAMLSSTAVAPPQLDEFFLEQDRDLRRGEIDALGWDEDALWRNWPAPR